MSNLLS